MQKLLYRNHLANCENFKSLYSKEEITEILFHSVPEDSKKKSKNCNKDIQAVFNFILPGLSLLNHKVISGKVLKKCANTLKKNITNIAKKDINSVTAPFDGWTNVKAEYIWEVVLLTSQGQSLIWGAHDISGESLELKM
ncbi:uncharacterized protein OCT59_003615 [Rhizophagus irregularis]|uniref:uncharacterized protein n=1 Tax=Rhizophagus irregularis TaxID=588596 RepID=UPI003325EBBE|nr:hypothetical protein OCT59_003615 [Rhizophagus irregularis]